MIDGTEQEQEKRYQKQEIELLEQFWTIRKVFAEDLPVKTGIVEMVHNYYIVPGKQMILRDPL